jgi:hypothetical protein
MDTTSVVLSDSILLTKCNLLHSLLYSSNTTKMKFGTVQLWQSLFKLLCEVHRITLYNLKKNTSCSSSTMASLALPPQHSYQNTLVALVSFLDGQKYHKDTVFLQDRLASITAEDVLRWMNIKCFGTATPCPDANPTGCRSDTILFWKKQSPSICQTNIMPGTASWSEAIQQDQGRFSI